MGAENPPPPDGSRPAASFDAVASIEIREIMPALDRAVGELKPRLQSGDYGLIVCEGASARIPALIMRGVTTRINHSRDRREIPLVTVMAAYNTVNDDYLSGYDHRDYETDFWQPEAEQLLLPAERRTLMGGLNPLIGGRTRVLLVTEFMQTGKHVRQIGREIHQAGLQYDIVAPSRVEDTRYYRGRGVLDETEELYPTSGHLQYQPGIKGKTHLSGLRTIGGNMQVARDRDSSRAAGRDVRRAVAMLVTKHKL